jgi:cytochrome b561
MNSAGVRACHWLTAALVVAAYALGKSDGYSLYSSAADGLRRTHETLGLLVFVVAVLRLFYGRGRETRANRPIPRPMAAAAKLVQAALYTLLIAIPIAAVLGTWCEGIPVTLPGFDISPPIMLAPRFGQWLMRIHFFLGNAILWVAGLHAAAALLHHFYLRDGVLRSMLLGR